MTRTQKFRVKVVVGYALVFATALAMSMAAMSFALAQEAAPTFPKCAPHDRYAAFLAQNYQESLRELGRIDETNVLEIYVSDAGTWTLLITNAEGRSCIKLSGDLWTGELPAAPAAPSEDAPKFRILPNGERGA